MDTPGQPAQTEKPLSIELTNRTEFFRELYFSNGQGSLFTYQATKWPLLWTVYFALAAVAFYLLSQNSGQTPLVILFVLTALATFGLLLVFLLHAGKYFQWKKEVNAMITKTTRFKKASLNANLQGFETVYDDTILIEKWSNVKRAKISPTHMFLFGDNGENYLFPAKSMLPSQYEDLTLLIRRAISKPAPSTNEPNPPASAADETSEIER